MNVKAITQEEFSTLVGTGNQADFKFTGMRPTLVDFSAEWCSYCKTLAPIFEELAGEYGDRIDFFSIDVDSNEQLTENFNIRTIPTLLFAQAGQSPQLILGTMNKAQLETKIKEVFGL
ncbi:MAG: thioredoxin family protein [Prevotella sp.]|nr:thioredoxin family protein [Prevotella sp.]